MERRRYIDRPHLFLSKRRCGCKVWAVRRTRSFRLGSSAEYEQARKQAYKWNVQRFCGVGPCEKHTCH